MYLRVVADGSQEVQPTQARQNAFEARHLEVRMFHVGHGECILIVFPNNRAWLVDAGKGNHPTPSRTLAENVVKYIVDNGPFLEAIIPSHPHADHAGAFVTILADPSPRLANPLTIYRSRRSGRIQVVTLTAAARSAWSFCGSTTDHTT